MKQEYHDCFCVEDDKGNKVCDPPGCDCKFTCMQMRLHYFDCDSACFFLQFSIHKQSMTDKAAICVIYMYYVIVNLSAACKCLFHLDQKKNQFIAELSKLKAEN